MENILKLPADLTHTAASVLFVFSAWRSLPLSNISPIAPSPPLSFSLSLSLSLLWSVIEEGPRATCSLWAAHRSWRQPVAGAPLAGDLGGGGRGGFCCLSLASVLYRGERNKLKKKKRGVDLLSGCCGVGCVRGPVAWLYIGVFVQRCAVCKCVWLQQSGVFYWWMWGDACTVAKSWRPTMIPSLVKSNA